MLNLQVHQSHSFKTLSPLPKPFIFGSGHISLPVQPRWSFSKTRKTVRIGSRPCSIKAIATVTEGYVRVKAVVTVKPTVGGFLTNIGIDRGLDDINDLLGKTLLLELVSSELDSKTGLEKDTIKGYAHRIGQKDRDLTDVEYESDFKVPADFGEIGAVLVENEHHEEMYVQDIVLDGFTDGPVNVNCRSWIHSKFKNPQKRVFFTNKVNVDNQAGYMVSF